MDTKEKVIHLYKSDQFITENPGDAFRVNVGNVLVFVAPLLKDGYPDKRILLCEVHAASNAKMIPALSYTDSNYRNWRFILTPGGDEEADIELFTGKCTEPLKRNFASRAGLTISRQEPFEHTITEFYNREALKDSIHITRNRRNEPEVISKAYDVIKDTYKSADVHIEGNSPLYRCIAAACIAAKFPIASAEKMKSIYGKNPTLQNIADASGFAFRNIVLDMDWYRKDCGTIIGKIAERDVALIPKGQNRYWIYYGDTGERKELTKEIAETVNPKVYGICRTLPAQSLQKKDLFRFCVKGVRTADLIMVLVLTLVAALIGILIPTLNQKIYDDYIPLGNIGELAQLCGVIATFMLSNLFFGVVKNLAEDRISSRVGYDLQNAVYYRIFRLPESFMRKYDSADMAQRLYFVRDYVDSWVDMLLISGIGAIFALLYFYKMFKYAPKLAWVGMAMLLLYAGIVSMLSALQLKHQDEANKKNGIARARLFQYLTGIEKIRLAGAEDRAALQYMNPFSEIQSAKTRMNRIQALSSVFSGVAPTVFTMVFYLIIVKKNVSISTGSFMAYNSAFGSFSSAILQLIASILGIYQLKPLYERFAPVIETAEEDDAEKEILDGFKGSVSLKDVSFAYNKDGPIILNGINMEIKSGEYVGIVGPSGCGKSTLLKLLLGFERPNSGQICYDGKDISGLDKRRLRKNLGVVLQNGQLISGSIYDNITITCPSATRARVNEVIEAVGLKHDVEQMPMGLETVLSENCGTISGGQKQRILIARAIINNPAVLIFDEATSALDNLTQAVVSESLDKMHSTRIVVAHRLSTIKNCDRIFVLENGKIKEEGNYDNLMKQGGLFYRLASRQMVE